MGNTIAIASAAHNVPQQVSEGSPGLSEAALAKLVESYLRFIHDRPHSIFHRQSLWRMIEQKTIPAQLLYSVCSLGAHVCPDLELRSYKTILAKHAKRLLWADVENVCLENIQTCILLANIVAADQDPSSEVLFFGVANRMAQLARIHVAQPEDGLLFREVKCRVWWSLVMADHWCSHGMGIPRQLDNSQTTVALPVDEIIFQEMTHDTNVTREDSDSAAGIWAYKTMLVKLLGPIHDLNRSIVEENVNATDWLDTLRRLSEQLESWRTTLPEELQLTSSNLEAHRKQSHGGTFVALHLGYHHYASLLYFQCLDTQTDFSADSREYAAKCRHHAISYSELLLFSRRRADCEAIYATVGHMTVVSSCVLLHNLLFGSESELRTTREHLTSNFEALIELKEYWPSLEKSVSTSSTLFCS